MISVGGIKIGKRPEKRRAPDRRPKTAERGYNARWRRRRAWYLKRHPVCVKCGRAARVVDHIVPHRGDRTLFNDETNWQALCVPCHNRKSAREQVRPEDPP